MERQSVIAAYNATEEAADGVALARLLAELTDSELVLARVLSELSPSPAARSAQDRVIRERVTETRRAVLAAIPDASSTPIVPLLDTNVARAVHDFARAPVTAEYLVLGSSHHRALGRMLLGGSAETVVNGAPCPVAIAPPGFRERPAISPWVVGAAYDGTPSAARAVAHGAALAKRLDALLRVITVEHGFGSANAAGRVAEEGQALAREQEPTLEVESVVLHGDPARVLVEESGTNVGTLVVGTRSHGAVARAVLGSVGTAVLRAARCPTIVVPRAK